MTNVSKGCIGITLGDPSGIGPEITAKALSKPSIRQLGAIKIIGERFIYQKYSPKLAKNHTFVDINSLNTSHPGKPNKAGAQSSFKALQTAMQLYKRGEITSLVTAPVCKKSIARIVRSFQGHTEFLAKALKQKDVGMMFISDNLRTIIVTRHIPLHKVSAQIKASNVYSTIALTHKALRLNFKIQKPCIAVCGLNPHAGEGGTIGKEEITKIIPAIKRARRNSINVSGPFAADTLFSPDIAQTYDAVVAMYHDQGLIPVKTLCLTKLVNLTIGLPLIRTSPAHGTAFDIAGQNKANPSSMCEAIKLANRLSL